MTDFEKSEWAQDAAVREYIDVADTYIPERRTMIQIVRSCYTHFVRRRASNETVKVLDLGSGDGPLMHAILTLGGSIRGTLIDGSPEMLERAKARLKSFSSLEYTASTFQSLIRADALPGTFDFVVSSLAIHHLTMDEKTALFRLIFNSLEEGGLFVNVDVVLPPNGDLEGWYLELWREWILERERTLKTDGRHSGIPQQYKDNPDNAPDTLSDQLRALLSIGFRNVDCYYKYGIFSVYGGRK